MALDSIKSAFSKVANYFKSGKDEQSASAASTSATPSQAESARAGTWDGVKSAFSRLSDYFKSSKTISEDEATSSKETPSVKTQVNYFGVDPKTKRFVRRYARLVSLSPYSLTIRVDGEDWVLPSHWDLTKLKLGVEPYILVAAFAYAKGEEKERLYRLPSGRSTFDEGSDLVIPLISNELHDQTLFQNAQFLSAQNLFNNAKASFTRAKDAVLSLLQSQAQFVKEQAIPELQETVKSAASTAQSIAPTVESAANVAAVNTRDLFKLLPREAQKKFRRSEKERQKIANQLMKPDK